MLRSFPTLPLLLCAALSAAPAVMAQDRGQQAGQGMAALPPPPVPGPQENVRIEFARVLAAEPVHQTLRATSMVERCEAASPVAEDDERRARVAVISADLNRKLFGGGNSVGRTLRIRDADVRIVGVLEPWRPSPQFYTLAGGNFSQGDTAGFYDKPHEVMVPFQTGMEVNDGHFAQFTCNSLPAVPGHLQDTDCVWLQLWVELGSAGKVAGYRRFVTDYAAQQKALGRMPFPDNARLLSLMQWLDYNRVVPRDVRLQSWLALAFLLICLFNTVGLLLAKFLQRSGEIGLRRALGASKRSVFAQCLTEAALIGLLGGAFGLLLTLLGLWAVRRQPVEYADLVRMDLSMFAATFAMAVAASLLAGMLPAARASRIAPALQIKSL